MVQMQQIVDRLNSTVWTRLVPSSIHGVGVFAIRDIPEGTVLVCDTLLQEDFILNEEYFLKLDKSIQEIILDRNAWVDDNISFHSPNADADISKFMNHSNNENYDLSTGKTNKLIKCGEEIFSNYNFYYKILKKISQDHIKIIKGVGNV